MMNKTWLAVLCFCCSLPAVTQAQQETPFEPFFEVQPDLAAFGLDVDRMVLINNVYLREDLLADLRQQAASFAGQRYRIEAKVRRVTRHEVELHVTDPGKTRLVVQHASWPTYGKLKTVHYAGGPSTQRANLLSQPVALRIGSEIDLDVARQLRRGDSLWLAGKLESVRLNVEGWFNPQAIAILHDWKVEIGTE